MQRNTSRDPRVELKIGYQSSIIVFKCESHVFMWDKKNISANDNHDSWGSNPIKHSPNFMSGNFCQKFNHITKLVSEWEVLVSMKFSKIVLALGTKMNVSPK
jgi:hypothetical protein